MNINIGNLISYNDHNNLNIINDNINNDNNNYSEYY